MSKIQSAEKRYKDKLKKDKERNQIKYLTAYKTNY